MFDGFRQANPDKKFIFIAAEKSLVIETDIVKFESIITNWPSRSSYFGIVDLAGPSQGPVLSLPVGMEQERPHPSFASSLELGRT